MPLPAEISIGAKYRPAMEAGTQEEADRMFEELVEHSMRVAGIDRVKAEVQERANLGYFAGYYTSEVRARVERLFSCAHPVFGPIENGAPTSYEAFCAGLHFAQMAKRRTAVERLLDSEED